VHATVLNIQELVDICEQIRVTKERIVDRD
jgi:hypothetical protein